MNHPKAEAVVDKDTPVSITLDPVFLLVFEVRLFLRLA